MTEPLPDIYPEFAPDFDEALRRSLTDRRLWLDLISGEEQISEVERWLKRTVHEIDLQLSHHHRTEQGDPAWRSRAARMKSLCEKRLIDLRSAKSDQSEKLRSATAALRALSTAVLEHDRGQIGDDALHTLLDEIHTRAVTSEPLPLRALAEHHLTPVPSTETS